MNNMRRTFTIIVGTLGIALLSTAAVLAGGGVSGTAKGHGQAVSEVAKAVDYVSGRAHSEAVSALAKTHGAAVSAATQGPKARRTPRQARTRVRTPPMRRARTPTSPVG
jgi:hypothetical protein